MYDVKQWKEATGVTVGELCRYMKENIPPEAVFHVCGSDHIYLHMDMDKTAFSVDFEPLSELPEYEDGEPERIGEAV
jgi:DNA polymerase III sliding clamp (beta) subunit (PCNA family)